MGILLPGGPPDILGSYSSSSNNHSVAKLVLYGPAHPNILGLFLAPYRHWYVSIRFFVSKKNPCHFRRKSSYNLIRLGLEIVHTMEFTWVGPRVCGYNNLHICNYVNSSKEFFNHLKKTRGVSEFNSDHDFYSALQSLK